MEAAHSEIRQEEGRMLIPRPVRLLFPIAFYAMATIMLSGCAVGRNELDGTIVLGFKAGRLVETTNQALVAGSQTLGAFLPAPWGSLIALAGTGLAAHLAGRNRGWDEHKAETGGAAPPPPPAPREPKE
jgi:hypothetical protein